MSPRPPERHTIEPEQGKSMIQTGVPRGQKSQRRTTTNTQTITTALCNVALHLPDATKVTPTSSTPINRVRAPAVYRDHTTCTGGAPTTNTIQTNRTDYKNIFVSISWPTHRYVWTLRRQGSRGQKWSYGATSCHMPSCIWMNQP